MNNRVIRVLSVRLRRRMPQWNADDADWADEDGSLFDLRLSARSASSAFYRFAGVDECPNGTRMTRIGRMKTDRCSICVYPLDPRYPRSILPAVLRRRPDDGPPAGFTGRGRGAGRGHGPDGAPFPLNRLGGWGHGRRGGPCWCGAWLGGRGGGEGSGRTAEKDGWATDACQLCGKGAGAAGL